MSSKKSSNEKLSLTALILMIFTSVYGFNNMPRSFYLMGYGAIAFFIGAGILFFIPFAFMMAEYGAAFKNERGGIYSWMEKSVNPKYAFVGTFMWYASAVIWMVNVSSAIWVPVSNAIYGTDITKTWSILGLNGPQTLGVLGAIWVIIVTYITTMGIDKIKKITSVGGTAVAALNSVLIVGAFIILIMNKGKLAQPVTDLASFFTSPNPSYQSIISVMSFLVFVIFAFGGIEVVGGLVDQTDEPEKNFPRGLKISAIVIAIGYSVGLFCTGIFTNWNDILGAGGKYGDVVHMGNVGYLIMNNLGYQLGISFGAAEATAIQLGNWIARFVGISMLLALTGAFFTMTYAPLKQLIAGAPKGLFPDNIAKTKQGMPINAMIIQSMVVVIIILLVAFGGDVMEEFFAILVSMTNVAMTIPYMFLSGAFISFKNKTEIQKPFEVFKSKSITITVTVIVTAIVGFANIFSIIEPAMLGNYGRTIWSIAGPVFFSIVALALYSRYEKNKEKS